MRPKNTKRFHYLLPGAHTTGTIYGVDEADARRNLRAWMKTPTLPRGTKLWEDS